MDPRIPQILDQNKDKQFVQRILFPDKYPKLDMGDGQAATHLMSWGQVGDKYVVYPTISYDKQSGLTRHFQGEAWKRARKSEDFIEFDTAEEADWFSKNYKQYWEEND